MASTIKVDKIEGSTGSTITVPTGQTLTLTDGLAVSSLPVVTVAKGGTNLSSFTAGDVLYATGSTTLAKLAKGTAEQVLAMNSGASAPDWGSVDLTVLPTITVAKGGTNIASFTAGDILYATGSTTLAKLAKGTALQALAMNSGATAPEWAGIAGVQTIWIPAQAMFGTTTNGADAQAVETTATRPEMKVLDFDAGTAEYAQFSIAMPKSWDLSTVTYQVFWSPSNTNTDNCIFGLQGVGVAEGGTADVTFPAGTEVTDAGIGTIEDVQMTAVSGAMTIKDTPADDDLTFFQLYRDAADGSDDFTGDARVLGIKLFYTTDALNDA